MKDLLVRLMVSENGGRSIFAIPAQAEARNAQAVRDPAFAEIAAIRNFYDFIKYYLPERSILFLLTPSQFQRENPSVKPEEIFLGTFS